MKLLKAPRAEPPEAQNMGSERAALGLGWAILAGLAASATTRALFRARRSSSTDAVTDGQEPDVLLDVRELEVARISLEVEDLEAHVSVVAELANLVRLSVGVDARLDRVKLEIEGVEAKVLLKVRLEHVRAILEKALDTVAEHPEILRILSRELSRLVRESLNEAQATLSEVLAGLQIGDTVDEVLRGRLEEVRSALEDILARQEEEDGGEADAPLALGEQSPNDTAPSASRTSPDRRSEED